MAVALYGEGVVESFKGLVDEAMDHQHVDAQEVTSWYVVQLLSSFARPETAHNKDTALSDQPSRSVWLRHSKPAGPVSASY